MADADVGGDWIASISAQRAAGGMSGSYSGSDRSGSLQADFQARRPDGAGSGAPINR